MASQEIINKIMKKNSIKIRELTSSDFDDKNLDNADFIIISRFTPVPHKIHGRINFINLLNEYGEQSLKNMDFFVVI